MIFGSWICFFSKKAKNTKNVHLELFEKRNFRFLIPGIPTTIKTLGVNITTIAHLRVLIIEIGSTIILLVVEAQGTGNLFGDDLGSTDLTENWLLPCRRSLVAANGRNVGGKTQKTSQGPGES